jgi:hypothetical protein
MREEEAAVGWPPQKGGVFRGFSLKIGMVRVMLLKRYDVRVCNE